MISYNRGPCIRVSSLLRLYITTLFAGVNTLMIFWMLAVILKFEINGTKVNDTTDLTEHKRTFFRKTTYCSR
jgi:hypothetical protein